MCGRIEMIVIVAVLGLLVGCTSDSPVPTEMPKSDMSPYVYQNPTGAIGAAAPSRGDMAKVAAPAAGEKTVDGEPAGGEPAETAAAVARKIIYNARLSLSVDNFDAAASKIQKLVKDFGGFVADSGQNGSAGTNRTGTWTIRVPVENFESLIAGLVKVGDLQEKTTKSDDVTRQFYDMEARIANKKVEESRLVKLLQEETGKLKDILDVEREISRVREEVERMQSQVRQWASLSSLSTITLTVNEYREYKPAQAPTFTVRVGRSFQQSVDGAIKTLESWVVGLAGFIPWLPFWIVGLVVAYLIYRIFRSRLRAGVTHLLARFPLRREAT